MITKTDKHLLITFIAETKKVNKMISKIKEYMGSDITQVEFNRKKKTLLSSNIYLTDNIFSINNRIVNDVLETGDAIVDIYNENDNLKYEELEKMLKQLKFKETSTIIIKNDKKKA